MSLSRGCVVFTDRWHEQRGSFWRSRRVAWIQLRLFSHRYHHKHICRWPPSPHTVIVFHRLNLGVATVLPVRVIAVDMQQIIQLSPLTALGKLILIHLYYKLLRPTYSYMVYFLDRLNQATKELSATEHWIYFSGNRYHKFWLICSSDKWCITYEISFGIDILCQK